MKAALALSRKCSFRAHPPCPAHSLTEQCRGCKGFPSHLRAPNMLNSVTLHHESVSNRRWQTRQASSSRRAQPHTAGTGTCQQHRDRAGTGPVGTSAFCTQYIALSLTCLLLQVQSPNPALLPAKECHSYLSTQVVLNYTMKLKMLCEGSPSYTVHVTV